MTDLATPLLYSSLGGDPDMGELVELFVEDIPDRIEKLQQAMQAQDMEEVGRLAHQMKGAVGGYGFDQLTPVATAATKAARNGEPAECVLRLAGELVAALGRVRAGTPD